MLKLYVYEAPTCSEIICVVGIKPLFYSKTGVYMVYIIFLSSAQTSIHNLCFEQKYKNIRIFYLKMFIFWW